MRPLDCGHLLVPFILFFNLLAGPCPAQQDPAERLPSLIYDVRDLVQVERAFSPATALEASFAPSPDDMRDDSRPAIEISDLATVIREAVSPEYWEQEGVDMRAEDTGFLTATCTEAMHARVRSVLGQLRQLLFEPVLIEVHELPGAALGERSILTAEQADSLLAQAGEHRMHFGRANPRKPLLLESRRTQNRILGLNATVASDASALALDVAAGTFGASWTVHAQHTVDDSLLITVLGSDRALSAEPATRKVATGDDQVATLELAATRIATCHGSAYLRPGQALLIGSNAPDAAVLCVRVRPVGPRVNGQIGALTGYPVAGLVRGDVRKQDIPVPHTDTCLFPHVVEDPMPAVFDEGRLMDWLKSQIAPETWDGAPNTMYYAEGRLFVGADDATQTAVAEQLRTLQNLDARQFNLEVRFGEVAQGAIAALRTNEPDQLAASLPHLCLSTLSASRETRISATRHTPYVREYRSSIANSSALTTPQIEAFTQGLLLRGKIAPMDQGRVMLDLQLSMLAHDNEHPAFDPRHTRLGAVDKIDVRQNMLRGATAVNLGKWTLLHLSPVEGGNTHFAVAARVQSL